MAYQCKCGNVKSFECEHKGPHIGLYCAKCKKWIKWITKDELSILLSIPGGLGVCEVTLKGVTEDVTINNEAASLTVDIKCKEGEEPW